MVHPKPPSSALLVSVRCLHEAAIASAALVDVIDFKEPLNGPLAAVDPGIWSAAAEAFPHATLSAALGESEAAIKLAHRVPASFRFAKVGPQGVRSPADLQRVWQTLPLRPSIELVPVAYADHIEADCLTVQRVLDCVIASGRRRMLIDTFAKRERTLTDYLPARELAALLHAARAAGIWVALAGSVQLAQVIELQRAGVDPDCWGVRGDVCVPGTDTAHRRQGRIDPQRVRAWRRALQPTAKQADPAPIPSQPTLVYARPGDPPADGDV